MHGKPLTPWKTQWSLDPPWHRVFLSRALVLLYWIENQKKTSPFPLEITLSFCFFISPPTNTLSYTQKMVHLFFHCCPSHFTSIPGIQSSPHFYPKSPRQPCFCYLSPSSQAPHPYTHLHMQSGEKEVKGFSIYLFMCLNPPYPQ